MHGLCISGILFILIVVNYITVLYVYIIVSCTYLHTGTGSEDYIFRLAVLHQ